MLKRYPITPIPDPISWAKQNQARLLFQQFDVNTRELRRSVIGLKAEALAGPSFPEALRRGLEEREAHGMLLVFAGCEALRGWSEVGPGGFPNHAVQRLTSYVEIDHVAGRAEMVQAEANSRADGDFAAEIPSPAVAGGYEDAEWRHDTDFESYVRRLTAIRGAARTGKISGAVLSIGLERSIQASPFDIYRRFVASNPSPFGYVFRVDGHDLVGSSPPAFLTARDRRLHLETDAGTRPVTSNPGSDDLSARDLASNPKDANEHGVVVEAETEALTSIARDGLVDTVINRQVRRFSHVMHLYTALEADLAAGLDMADAILALAPAAAVSGHPKRVAAKLGVALEGGVRGPYGGVIGLIDVSAGTTDMAVVIRSAWISDGVARLRVGGKIVPHSDAESEYRECLAKARFIVEGIDRAERARARRSLTIVDRAS